jgi:hypothetical protein
VALVLNFALFQAGWFAAVLSAAKLVPMLGVAVIAVVVALHLRWSRRPGREFALIVICAMLGGVFDSLLAAAGWVAYPSGQPLAAVAPYWIVAMWMSFATTLNVSLRWLRNRTLLAAALGLAGGPLAYFTGERLGGIVLVDTTAAMVALGIGWGVMMPLLSAVSQRFDGMQPQSADQPLIME